MTDWFKFFIAFDAIFMFVNYYQNNTIGTLYFGFLLIATILIWSKK